MDVHVKNIKGRRPTNEDAHTIFLNIDGHDTTKPSVNLFAIYDGHGGNAVSKILSKLVPPLFLDKRIIYPLHKPQIIKLCMDIQNVLKNEHPEIAQAVGSTCLIVAQYLVHGEQFISICNIGDCRCIACHDQSAIAMTKDHKPSWPEEMARINSERGKLQWDGVEWRIDDLSVSRSFGDLFSTHVSPIPDLFKYKITSSDKFLVLACDGLWDAMNNQDVVNFVLYNCYDINTGKRKNKQINIAAKLAKYAYELGSADNITVIVAFLN